MMDRRTFILATAAGLLAAPLAAGAQPAGIAPQIPPTWMNGVGMVALARNYLPSCVLAASTVVRHCGCAPDLQSGVKRST
jgi:hypothetical protein